MKDEWSTRGKLIYAVNEILETALNNDFNADWIGEQLEILRECFKGDIKLQKNISEDHVYIIEHYQTHKCLIPPLLNPQHDRYRRYLREQYGS